MRRIDSGRPIREAMDRLGYSIPKLARATRELDPYGDGISKSVVGAMVSTGTSGREDFRPRSAGLVAAVLREPVRELFVE